MNVELVLSQLDSLIENRRTDLVEGYLREKMEEAAEEGDRRAVITLMNELISYYGGTGEFEKMVEYCQQVLLLLQGMGMKGTIPYAATLLHVADAYREAGLLSDAMRAYQEVKGIYEGSIAYNDFRYVELYQGMSLLFQQTGDDESACDCLQRALSVASQYQGDRIEVAAIYTNLALAEIKLLRYEEAMDHLKRAISLYEMDEERDYHYSGALSAMGEVLYMTGELEESARFYKLALLEIERTSGRNQAYEITLQNLHAVIQEQKNALIRNRSFEKGMELCQAFYEEYGIPMIRTRFPAYEGVIAAGLVGEGSECFGYDDEVSRDHDFGPGFCLWLTDQVYDEIGEELQQAYDELPHTFMGVTRVTSAKARKRVGVFRIREFYGELTGLQDVPVSRRQWEVIQDYQLSTATNGRVFRDDLGEFTRIRKGLLAYYPEEVRLKKIAREAALMAQAGQYNYSRMLGRNETVTAQIALAEFMKHTMAMIYLLNRSYAPFYKWMHRGLEKLPLLKELRDVLTALSQMPVGDERIPETIEFIVSRIIAEMKKEGLTSGEDNYLEHHTENILKGIPTLE